MAGQNFEKYDSGVRFRNWQRGFDKDFKNLESSIDTDLIIAKDPNDIYLTDLTNQLIEWEDKLKNYYSKHKTDDFHDFQDCKSKLLIQLDSIDISDSPQRRADRLKVYDRLDDIKRKFEKKIHEGHSTCKDCVQVKVVMINL